MADAEAGKAAIERAVRKLRRRTMDIMSYKHTTIINAQLVLQLLRHVHILEEELGS